MARPLRARTRWVREGLPDRLLTRLAENERILTGACNLLTAAVDANRRIAPAGEWLLDNFYLIEEQIRTAKRHLPKGYSRNCRACWTARRPDFRACTTSRWKRSRTATDGWTRKASTGFVAAYQTVTVAHAGRTVGHPDHAAPGADRESSPRRQRGSPPDSIDRNRADSWADQMTEIAEKDPKSLILVMPTWRGRTRRW